MDSRREFIKKAAMLSGAAGMSSLFPSIVRAFEINPAPGTTWRDAEHVVILMQENRSFDHCYGALRGVRGFNDPRAITLPNNNRVWLQTNEKGETFAPFRLNIKDTNATWMGSLPHGWTDQVDARNDGRFDKWLIAKQPGRNEYKHMPLTLGYYNREDVPFYYSLADAFTVCDQNFCSSLTGTTPNRLYLWTGKIREDAKSPARVRNSETDYGVEAAWKTFPERLEENNVSWRIYQNEISVGVGLEGEEDAWLANFTDNPLEWMEQYRVRFHPAYMKYLPKKIADLRNYITQNEEKLKSLVADPEEHNQLKQKLERARLHLETSIADAQKYTPENYNKLTQTEKNLHEKAFTTNWLDPEYHQLETLTYHDSGVDREMKVPKGDVLFQFRDDVKNGKLPAVSWLIAPENFSDHPGAPWYGAWYVSEAMDILTQNPEVWKKTIFIICYDENDGYFDHVPPFVPPVPGDPTTGLVSKGIDTQTEYFTLADDLKRSPAEEARGSAIGLGYRVPLVVASPWSRGGAVCSQVFDHTSIIQFLEKFVNHKTGKEIRETNISDWRRTICGDLTSVFTPYHGEKMPLPEFLDHDKFVESIHKAQFKKEPSGFKALTNEEIATANRLQATSIFPRQEKGTRVSRALPYELSVNGKVKGGNQFEITFEAGKKVFGNLASGAPFSVYGGGKFSHRSYAVKAGDVLTDTWNDFANNICDLKVYGPNGFFRAFKGKPDTGVEVHCGYEFTGGKLTGKLQLMLTNLSSSPITLTITDHYQKQKQMVELAARKSNTIKVDSKSSGWYDVSVSIENTDFVHQFAGRIETGKEGISDPAMA